MHQNTGTYDQDKNELPRTCPFCGNEIEEFILDDMDELKMDDDED